MTPRQLSAKVIAERPAQIHRMIASLRNLPGSSLVTFQSDPRNIAAADSYLRREDVVLCETSGLRQQHQTIVGTRSMRIGVNLLPLFPGQIGGMETYIVNLLTRLTAIDRQYTYYFFIARYNQALFEAQLQQPNTIRVRTLSLQGLRYAERGPARAAGAVGRRLPRMSRWLVNAVASAHMLSSIHKHKLDLWFCPLINLAPRHIRIPSVVCIPDLQPAFHPEYYSRDLADWYRKRLSASCREATQIITLSEFSRSTIADRYGISPEKIHAIPLAVGNEFPLCRDEATLEAIRSKYNLPARYAFYPANTWPHKNHVTLLKALHLLRVKYSTQLPCVFTGVARGGHEAFLETAEELNLDQQVRVLGHVERRDMPLLYRGASLLIFPSLFEGFGLPLLEAMTSDCPVVCSNAASIPEVVGDAALLVDPHDPEAIADAMHRVLTEEDLRHRLIQAGRKRCRHFSWERTARETLKVLEEAASIGRRPSSSQC